MTRYIKRGGKVWIRIFPCSYNKKPIEAEWERVKVRRILGSKSTQGCCTKWRVSEKSQEKLLDSLLQNSKVNHICITAFMIK